VRAAGAVICLTVLTLMWWLVVYGGVLQAMEWVRRCPVCHLTLRKRDPRDQFRCERCGWSG
jgi:hypothetical protein